MKQSAKDIHMIFSLTVNQQNTSKNVILKIKFSKLKIVTPRLMKVQRIKYPCRLEHG
jgi:hypothetical protein